ncbi:hypothetical protein ACFQMA_07980 [Halosimplex aquaticum]|uniref:PD-(D/E)XK nuclease superfamily protein n=1 Tax=Halosimplex aquaticum TaxID=3026162 RepID=A0ABD5Y220_9EURY|nr:hypothetical protein [Halosimplex aquaticum]
MPNPLFSTYTQGENRVTSTLLAVLEHVNSRLAEDILEAITDESDLSLVGFDNQVTGTDSVPDAAIRASTALWFETKTSRDAVRREQLDNHLQALDEDPSDLQRLIVLTPDTRVPPEVQAIDDERIVWASFDTLVGSIESVLERDVGSAEASMYVPTEREAFLLRELVRFIYDESLVSGQEDRVLVVAARKAWPEYHKYGLYFCQPNRSFKPVSHLAFYKDGEIKTTVPKVTGSIESVTLDEETVRGHPDLSQHQESELLRAVELMRENGSDRYRETEKVLFLEEDVELEQAIRNDKTASDSNRTVAFVQGHRYVSLTTLQENPTYTTELEE